MSRQTRPMATEKDDETKVGHMHNHSRPQVTLRQRRERPLLYDLQFIQTHFATDEGPRQYARVATPDRSLISTPLGSGNLGNSLDLWRSQVFKTKVVTSVQPSFPISHNVFHHVMEPQSLYGV